MNANKKYLYFDYAATTPVDRRVQQAMNPFMTEEFYNPSSLYSPARRVRTELETARGKVSAILGARPNEIIFTAGATESINLAIKGVASNNPNGKIIVSAIEHESVLASAVAAFGKSKVKICPVKPNGIIDLQKLESLIDKSTCMISVMYANNEIGTVQPLAKINKIIQKQEQRIVFHSDAAQAGNYLSLHANRFGLDLMTLNGSKLYGPKQSGCLYVRSGVDLAPLIVGGGQEQGLRSGTENVASCIGFAYALEIAQLVRADESARLSALRNQLIEMLCKNKVISLNGDKNHRLPNNINICVARHNGERLVHDLDARGILVATGSACSANNDTPSHVLLAIGLSEEAANSSLRITLGRQTRLSDIKQLASTLNAVISV